MSKFFINFSFALVLLVSVLSGFSQTTLLSSWVMLELNMLAFLVVLSLSKDSHQASPLKYYMVQSVGSAVFLLGLSLGYLGSSLTMASTAIGVGLLLKLGAAPFHSWLVSFMANLDWGIFFMASTMQKVLPVYLISQISLEMLSVAILSSAVVSVLGSFNQTLLKKLLAYSSVFSAAWMLSSGHYLDAALQYLGVYSLSLAILVLSVLLESALMASAMAIGSTKSVFVAGLSLLSMGGMPPLAGFYAKILVMGAMCALGQLGWLVSLVFSSVFILYAYIRVFLSALSAANYESHLGTQGELWASMLALLLMGVLSLVVWALRMGVKHSKIWTFSY